jgi:hypothetical protein
MSEDLGNFEFFKIKELKNLRNIQELADQKFVDNFNGIFDKFVEDIQEKVIKAVLSKDKQLKIYVCKGYESSIPLPHVYFRDTIWIKIGKHQMHVGVSKQVHDKYINRAIDLFMSNYELTNDAIPLTLKSKPTYKTLIFNLKDVI